ncbi:MAG: hypothetical protein L0H84_20320, partial [Pseudonocardia sp.]|nr:hypothetical protein [Pseudonocardia sp.]
VEMLDLAAVRTLAAAVGDPAELRGRLGLTITVPDGQHPSAPTARLLDALVASTITVAPLRRKPDAVATLAQVELRRLDPGMTFAADALAVLRRHHWPGNLAELARVVRDAARDTAGAVVTAADLPVRIRNANERRPRTPLESAESSVIVSVLRKHGGNKSTAARELGISRTALYAKIRTYRI